MTLVRGLAIVTLATLVLLAGCSGPPGLERDSKGSGGSSTDPGGGSDGPGPNGGGDPAPPTQNGPHEIAMLLDFDLLNCTGFEAVTYRSASAVQSVLPEGYTALIQTDSTGSEGVPVQYVWTACSSLETPTTFVNNTVFGYVSARIEPPAQSVEASEHWFRLRMLAQEDILAALWQAAGYEVIVGDYSDSTTATPLPGGSTLPEARTIRLGDYQAQGLASVSSGVEAISTAQYTEIEGGRLVWTGQFDSESFRGFTGQWSFPADDPFGTDPSDSADPLSMRYVDSVSWLDNDLWLIVPQETP